MEEQCKGYKERFKHLNYCVVCNDRFETISPTIKTCSIECRKIMIKNKQNEKREKRLRLSN